MSARPGRLISTAWCAITTCAKARIMADIQVNLAGKDQRQEQSHDIAKRVRPPIERSPTNTGPGSRWRKCRPARRCCRPWWRKYTVRIMNGSESWPSRSVGSSRRPPGWWMWTGIMEEDRPAINLKSIEEKAAFMASAWPRSPRHWRWRCPASRSGLLHQPREKEDVPIVLRLPLVARAGIERLQALKINGSRRQPGASFALITSRADTESDRSIYHKNLMPVVYVIGDVAGAKESPVYAILEMRKKIDAIELPEGYRIEQHTAHLPTAISAMP